MKKFIPCLSVLAVITIIFGTIYGTTQQSLRQSANDPQVQMAEDAASQLNIGTPPAALTASNVDMASSLAPFLIIYSRSGQLATGSGYLNGRIPTIAYGVLTHATASHNNQVTWQPAKNVRIASVTVAADHYYVVAGRSLRLVEQRETSLFYQVAFGWLITIGGLILAWLVYSYRPAKKKS